MSITAPFQQLHKKGILEMGFEMHIPVPYQLTRTCYKDDPIACGKCGSCQERLEAFRELGKADPLPYQLLDGGL